MNLIVVLIIMLAFSIPLAMMGFLKIEEILKHTFAKKKGKIKIWKVGKTGRLEDMGFHIPQDDDTISIKGDVYPIHHKRVSVGKYGVPVAYYTEDRKQIDLREGGTTHGVMMEQFGHILNNTWSAAKASVKKNMRQENIMFYIMLGVLAILILATIYEIRLLHQVAENIPNTLVS